MKIIISGICGTDYKAVDVRVKLAEANGQEVIFEMNSPGGSFFEAVEIVNLIKSYSGETVAKIVGLAASAASYISTACKKVVVLNNSVYMVHNAQGVCVGDHRAMRKTADILENLSIIMAESYSEKSGKSVKEIRELFDAETWLYGNQILENGFADEYEDSGSNEDFEEVKASFTPYTAEAAELNKIAACFNTNTERTDKDREPGSREKGILRIINGLDPTGKNSKLQALGRKLITEGTSFTEAAAEITVVARDTLLTAEELEACRMFNLTEDEFRSASSTQK